MPQVSGSQHQMTDVTPVNRSPASYKQYWHH